MPNILREAIKRQILNHEGNTEDMGIVGTRLEAMNYTGRIEIDEVAPQMAGGFADVTKAYILDEDSKRLVSRPHVQVLPH